MKGMEGGERADKAMVGVGESVDKNKRVGVRRSNKKKKGRRKREKGRRNQPQQAEGTGNSDDSKKSSSKELRKEYAPKSSYLELKGANLLIAIINFALEVETDEEEVHQALRDYVAKKWPFNQFQLARSMLEMAKISPCAAARKVDMARLYWCCLINATTAYHFCETEENRLSCLACSVKARKEFTIFVNGISDKKTREQGQGMQKMIPKLLEFIKNDLFPKKAEPVDDLSRGFSSLAEGFAELDRLAKEDEEELKVECLSEALKCVGDNGELEDYTVSHGSGEINERRKVLTARLKAAKARFASKRH